MTDLQTLPALPATLAIEVAGASDIGGRANNEDVALAIEVRSPRSPNTGPPTFLLAVADGMGGHAGGEVASRVAIETLKAAMQPLEDGDAARLLKNAFRRANEAILAEATDTGVTGMGTTLTAALLRGSNATIASVGDSRAYLVRGSGLTQITKDHTLVAEQVAQGTLTAEQARADPQRNILTQALGNQPRLAKDLPTIFEIPLLPEDRLLLCTDGFHDVLEARDYTEILKTGNAASAVQQLIGRAKERSATDNVSAVVAVAVPTRVTASLPPPVAARGMPVGAIAAAAIVVILLLLVVAVVALGLVP